MGVIEGRAHCVKKIFLSVSCDTYGFNIFERCMQITGMSFTSANFTLLLTKLHIDMQEIYFELIINIQNYNSIS